MDEKKQTITYFNILKTLSIFLVVFCHITLLKNKGYMDNIAMLFCWAGVPCFLMVNGALLFNKELKINKHYKKLLMIYIVNIVWRIIYLIISTEILHSDIDFEAKSQIFKYIFCFGDIKGVNTGHLYFITALISCYLIFPVLYQSYKTKEGKKCLFIFCVILFVLIYGINAINFITSILLENNKLDLSGLKSIIPFNEYSQYLLFFIIGGFLDCYKEKIQGCKYIKIITGILIIISLVGLAMIRYNKTKTFQWNGELLTNGYGRMCTFIMSISVFVFFQGINIENRIVKKVVDIIGYNTLSIFYMHIPILSILSQYVFKYITFRGVWVNILKTIIVIAIIELITIVLKRIPIIKKILS